MKSNHYGQELAGWLVSGYCVYSVAMHYSTGDRLAAATLGVVDRVVSLRLTETKIAGQSLACSY